ncbi:MAG TPA: alkaline phosphatase family protein, partial [bacterium]|nr:alkaline phosphatase family protein [bacterium]
EETPAAGPSRLLLFGLDAAGWDVLKPMCRQGYLPNISRAMENGIAADMKTLDPTVSVMLWTTIATGMLPENHGISNWLSEGMDTSGQLAITSDRRRVPAFWNLTGDRKILVANWWASWPVEPVNGVMVSNRAHFPELDHTVYPPEFAAQIAQQPRISREALEHELTVLNPDHRSIRLSEFFARQLQKDRFYLDVFENFLSRDRFDIAAVFIRGIDILEHEYLRDVREDATAIPEVPVEQQGIVKAYYRYVDRWLGRLTDLMGPDTGIVLVSDHGMDPVDKLPPLIEGLDLNKLLRVMERTGNGMFDFDGFNDNQKYPPGLRRGVSWIGNGTPPDGRVEKLAALLRSIRCDHYSLFRTVTVTDDPHERIHLELDPSPTFKSVIRFQGEEIPVMSVTGMIIHPRSGQHWHAPDGIFLATGPGIRSPATAQSIRIQDIMPTLMHWMALPVADDLDGQPMSTIFTDEFLAGNPPVRIKTYGPRSGSSAPVEAPEAVEESIRSELESLGYIQID